MSRTVLKRIAGDSDCDNTRARDFHLDYDGPQVGGLSTEHGYLPLTALGYRCRIRSLAIRTEISQTFYNPYDVPMEATYIFPLNSDAAVTDCQLRVGDRVIRADLAERSIARRRYQQAINDGHRAALLEENRSETFSLKVGNIAPGEAVQIRLITVGKLPLVGTEWTLRLPLVIAPRYTSGISITNIPNHSATMTGTQMPTDEVPDAPYITPPVLVRGFKNKILLNITVDLDLKMLRPDSLWADHLRSSLHSVLLDDQSQSCRVEVRPDEAIDRDFILRGQVTASDVMLSTRVSPPTTERRGTFAIDVVPPPQASTRVDAPRRIVFLLDRSGSMCGWKFNAAQRGLAKLIVGLNPRDRFEVIAFDCALQSFGQRKLSIATEQTVFAATKWISRLNEAGGTEMAVALDAALDLLISDQAINSKADAGTAVPSIVLITDGQITGEDHLLARLKNLPDAQRPRIYTLGVDRAVNASVLKRISNATNGTFELVETEQRLSERIDAFAAEIGRPVLRDIKITTDLKEDCEVVLEGTDLYVGRAVSIYGRLTQPHAQIQLTAKASDGTLWHRRVDIASNGCAGEDLISLWGRQRVRYLEDQYAISNSDDPELRQEIVDVSLASRVLSRFTAYVAVDETEVIKCGALNRVTQPTELPEGWKSGKLMPIPKEDRLSIDKSTFSESGVFSEAEYQAKLPKFSTEAQHKVTKSLLKSGALKDEQLKDALDVLPDAPAQAAMDLGYVTEEEVTRAIAQAARVPFVKVMHAGIDPDGPEFLPEAVARENHVVGVGVEDGRLVVATVNPFDVELGENLRFVLNRDINFVASTRGQIAEAIDFYYGQIEGESADSMLQEFTDSKIDFTETVVGFEEDDDFIVQEFRDYSPDADEVALFGEAEANMRASRLKAREDEKRREIEKWSGRLLEMMLTEIYHLEENEIVICRKDDHISIAYGITSAGEMTLKERDRLPKAQWKWLLKALKEKAQLASGKDGVSRGRLSWTDPGGEVLEFAVLVDEKSFIKLSMKTM